MSEWRNVADGYPGDVDVLVWFNGLFHVATYQPPRGDEPGWWFTGSAPVAAIDDPEQPEWWMPLPAAPVMEAAP